MSKADYPYEYKKFEGDMDPEFDLTWTPKQTFQFAKKSLREAYEKKPDIEWYLTERSYDLWSKGRRPDQYQSLMEWAGQGYPFLIKFVESHGKVVGIANLFPSRNPGDNLDGKDADGKPFSYNGITFDFTSKYGFGNSGTGAIHWDLKEKEIKEIDEKLYSGKGDELAGGTLKGGKDVIGEFRVVSSGFNSKNIHLNPLMLLLNCETEADLFFYKRTMPHLLSQSFLDYLLKELPLSPGQERTVTLDTRIEGGTPSQTVTKSVQSWEKLTDEQRKQSLQERLIYFVSRPHIKDNAWNPHLLLEGCRDQKVDIDVNFKDSHGRTALSHAFEKKNDSAIESLIQFGADLDIKDKNNKSPLDYNPDLVKYLINEFKWDNPANKEIFVKKYEEYQQQQKELLCKASRNSFSFMPAAPRSTPTVEQSSTSTLTQEPLISHGV